MTNERQSAIIIIISTVQLQTAKEKPLVAVFFFPPNKLQWKELIGKVDRQWT